MAVSINSSPVQRRRALFGQTLMVIGGSSGIGLEAARLARAQGADIILTARTDVAFTAALTAALSALTTDLALEIAPVRVNLIAAGSADALPSGTRPAASPARPTSLPWPSAS